MLGYGRNYATRKKKTGDFGAIFTFYVLSAQGVFHLFTYSVLKLSVEIDKAKFNESLHTSDGLLMFP